MTVFKYNVWFKNADGTVDYDHRQERYVVAESEEEADAKMENHAKELLSKGFAEMHFVYKGVEIDSVII